MNLLFGRSKNKVILWLCRLLPHPHKTHIHRVAGGVPFLGFRVFPYYRFVKKENAHRAERFVRGKVRLRRERRLSPDQLEAGLNSWLGHVRFGQCRRLEGRVFRAVCGQGVNVCRHPRGAWRVLEYDNLKSGVV